MKLAIKSEKKKHRKIAIGVTADMVYIKRRRKLNSALQSYKEKKDYFSFNSDITRCKTFLFISRIITNIFIFITLKEQRHDIT
jgi:hypothetical protein